MKRFNVRVYGVFINSRQEVLVSDEVYKNTSFTKFPGGGLEWGESTKDCLIREFQEEFGLKIRVSEHLFTTDFFQVSVFSEHDQVLSIYYLIDVNELELEKVINSNNSVEQLRWLGLDVLSVGDLTFPIDQKVVEILKS